MERSRQRRRQWFIQLMQRLQSMPEQEVGLVAQIAGKVVRARRSMREAAEAAAAHLDAQEQKALALSAPEAPTEPKDKVPEKLN